ncbi:MAG: hypothetical protein JRN20_13515 [Nitrososphaerota archaeon]|nr:hypothetical protein [Nitrososphaerota archaeon]
MTRLLLSPEPSIRYRVLVNIVGVNPQSEGAEELREEIRRSARVMSLLSERANDGKIHVHPYSKWYGAHWVLTSLADLDYPQMDSALIPMRDQVYAWLFSQEHTDVKEQSHPYSAPYKTVRNRVRIHASIEGNALYSTLKLGIGDERTDALAERLVSSQWEDGGWNCDKTPSASHSSFNESLLPLRGLIYHSKLRNSRTSIEATERAAEYFLKRRLFRRLHDGKVISERFLELHYPSYWHYDILSALRVMAEGGFIGDSRCKEALELLRARELPGGGFPADRKFYRTGKGARTGRSLVSWGDAGEKMNEFVTADALWVLNSAKN